jgi:hypothetical protein
MPPNIYGSGHERRGRGLLEQWMTAALDTGEPTRPWKKTESASLVASAAGPSQARV